MFFEKIKTSCRNGIQKFLLMYFKAKYAFLN